LSQHYERVTLVNTITNVHTDFLNQPANKGHNIGCLVRKYGTGCQYGFADMDLFWPPDLDLGQGSGFVGL
tara:strand:+ start:27998 stop:28207 length:210 start_codon:yes stop_codon:yes gene_type:complete